MTEWWNALNLDLQIFYAIGVLSTLVILIQAILMLFGGDADGGDFNVSDPSGMHDAAEHSGGAQLLSVRTVTAFFVGFGWTGAIFLKRGWSLESSLLFAFLVGSFFMTIVFYLMKTFYNLRDSGNINYRNAVGKIGSVYIPIPPNQSGPGQIEILIQGRVSFVDAFTNASQKLPGQTRVKVLDLIDSRTLLVESLSTLSTKEE
ncbi:MAG: hypothetical protein C4527_22210 [Candidatus Omnitrophota bacterium]|jgi:hypothetical protein|nr:MAG: hypothetical protein C4527_22210 [Candidatus Omnitrophota bacterium]